MFNSKGIPVIFFLFLNNFTSFYHFLYGLAADTFYHNIRISLTQWEYEQIDVTHSNLTLTT